MISDAANMRMFSFGPEGCLSAFTCVLPWCVDVLDEGANCAVTDTTFRILKPYTLAILTLIFANESIPIAFSVSPTEDEDSYLSMSGGRQPPSSSRSAPRAARDSPSDIAPVYRRTRINENRFPASIRPSCLGLPLSTRQRS
jgi:hypothetical protein